MVDYNALGSIGREQFRLVMKTFRTKKLRGRDGQTITDQAQAQAIAFSEGRAADKRGTSTRTWKGSTRTRPRLKVK